MSDDDGYPNNKRETALTAALRVILAERNWQLNAVPRDDECDARDAFALAARAYVRAIDRLPVGRRPDGWDLDDAEELRVLLTQVAEERNQLRAWNKRQDRTLDVFMDYHRDVHPLPEDVRRKVVAAMDGTTVEEVTD